MRYIYLFLVFFFMTGCDILESQEDKEKKIELQKIAFEKRVSEEKEIQLQKLADKVKMELAILESKKELALLEYNKEMALKKISNISQKEKAILKSKKDLLLIEKNQELEKIRINSEIEKQKIIFEKEKKEALFQQKLQQIDQVNNMELKRYLIMILALIAVVSSFFIFYYFKKRREDKLIAYNDNLEKYFRQKENETRMKIAEKLLDTIASGNLDRSQENQLIGVLNGSSAENKEEQKLLSRDGERIEDVEVIVKY